MSNNKQPVAFLLDCAKRGQTRGKQPPPSICKVSRILRNLSVRSFIPQLVSIGPIHSEKKKLKEFEWQKECYLDDLLNRCYSDSTPKETLLEACLQKVNDLIPEIRKSYASCVIENYSEDELARMMVMDGCFILEFCFKHEEENEYLPNKMQNSRIAMDLMLLENQVPFSVLQALFECCMGDVRFTLCDVLDTYLAPYIKLFHSLPEKNSSNVLDKYLAPYVKLFRSLFPEKNSTTDVDSDLSEKNSITDVDSDLSEKNSTIDVDSSDSTYDHVLGYMHKRYQLVAAESSKPKHAEASKLVDEEQAAKSSNPIHADAETSKLVDEEQKENIIVYHSIVELDRSGMKFKPHQDDEWSMTIKFQSPPFLPWFWRPTLLMPTLLIDDFTELILRNFIAYEQSFPQDRYYFSSYAHAMDMLINTEEDIAKLAKSKVLVSTLGSNQETADMMNKIGRNISVKDFNYTEVFKQMVKYHKGHFWPKNIASLKRAYFNNPWNFLALLGALILFGLTVTQTVYTIRAA